MTITEAAAALGIGRDAAWARVKRGTLPRVDGMVGPAGEIYVDISQAVDRRRRPPRQASDRPSVPSDRPTDNAPKPSRPSVPASVPSEPSVPPSAAAAPAVDDRDVRIAALEAEREGLYHLVAYTKDQLELAREEHRETVAGMRADHQREVGTLQDVIEGYRREIDGLMAAIGSQAAAIGDQSDLIRASQARNLPMQLVDVVETGNAREGTLEALERDDPPFATDKTLNQGNWLSRNVVDRVPDGLRFWERTRR